MDLDSPGADPTQVKATRDGLTKLRLRLLTTAWLSWLQKAKYVYSMTANMGLIDQVG